MRVCVFSGCGTHSGQIMAYQKSSQADDAERKGRGLQRRNPLRSLTLNISSFLCFVYLAQSAFSAFATCSKEVITASWVLLSNKTQLKLKSFSGKWDSHAS